MLNTGSTLLDTIMLAAVSKDAEGTHGYRITQDVRQVIDISEFTLYPVPRRLRKEGCLEAYDIVIDGRDRRCYGLTERGRAQLSLYRGEWVTYSQKISQIFKEAKL